LQPRDCLEEILNSNASYKRCFPLEPYYQQRSICLEDNNKSVNITEGTEQLASLRSKFKLQVLDRSELARSLKPPFSFPQRQIKLRPHKHHGISFSQISFDKLITRINFFILDECGLSCDSD